MKETCFAMPFSADLSMYVPYEFDQKGNMNFSWNNVDPSSM